MNLHTVAVYHSSELYAYSVTQYLNNKGYIATGFCLKSTDVIVFTNLPNVDIVLLERKLYQNSQKYLKQSKASLNMIIIEDGFLNNDLSILKFDHIKGYVFPTDTFESISKCVNNVLETNSSQISQLRSNT